jgi:UDP-2,3-diacylglucosamine pyrophosphatase LpxH
MDATRIIISDLHIGANDKFDIFNPAVKLPIFEKFINFVRSQDNAVELIIDGDFVDFLQLQEWGDYSRGTATRKAGEIAKANLGVFRALGSLLTQPRHQIKVLLGNHDVELAYDETWKPIQEAILGAAPAGAGARLQFLNRRITDNFRVNNVLVHVEHGNIADNFNSINYGPLFADAEQNTKTFSYPPGTKFVYDTINQFKERYQIVDLLKPEVPAVPLILLALSPLAAARRVPDAVLKALGALGNGFVGKLREIVSGPQFGLAQQNEDAPQSELLELLANTYRAAAIEGAKGADLDREDTDDAEAYLASTEQPGTGPKATFGGTGVVVRRKLLAAAMETLERFKQPRSPHYFEEDHADNLLAKRAAEQMKGDVRIVVYGHTHEALKAEFGQGIYINSGTWADLIDLPSASGQFEEWLKAVHNNTFDRPAFPTFVQIEPEGSGCRASLNHWHDTKREILWSKIA